MEIVAIIIEINFQMHLSIHTLNQNEMLLYLGDEIIVCFHPFPSVAFSHVLRV